MRKVSDISTVHKGDNTLCVYWSLYYCNCVCSTELSARKKLSVDLLKFVLFLYIQNAPRVSLKSSIVNDQYPLSTVVLDK